MPKKRLIREWQRKMDESASENRSIAKRLARKKGKALDERATSAHDDVFSEIDCLACANCCISIPPIVTKTDASRIARKFRMKPSAFEQQYLLEDEDGDTVMNASPCPFLLANNECLIYDIRPRACRQFPHTGNLDFSKNMKLHSNNANICPAVFHILRKLDGGD